MLQPTLHGAVTARARRRQDPAPAGRCPRPASRPRSAGATPAALPELNEPEVIRHFVNLSHLNYDDRLGLLSARLVHR